MVEKLFYWYLANQDELVNTYNGKYLLISSDGVAGAYGNVSDAYFDALERFQPETFIIQKCSEGDRDYSRTSHSSLAFV